MATASVKQRFRVVGSGYTLFSYNGQNINFCQEVQDTPPQPVAPPQPVQPIDAQHPLEIAVPSAAGAGQLTLTIIEQWSQEVWAQFPGYSAINDIVDLLNVSASIGGVTCVKLITPPSSTGVASRMVIYHGCMIVNANLGEDVRIESMTVGKTVQLMYTSQSRKTVGS